MDCPKQSAPWRASVSFWRLYAPFCGAGLSGLACGVLDYAWANPAFPRTGDPAEALAESSGEERLVRYLLLALCAAYVFSAGVAVIAVASNYKLQKSLTQAHILIAFLLTAAAAVSNRLAGARYYKSAGWQGPNWAYTQALMASGLGMSLIAAHHVPAMKQQVYTLRKQTSGPSRPVAFCAGGLLCLAGVALLCLGVFFHMHEPETETLAILGDHVSFLEWECGGGSFDLGETLRVQWGPDTGLIVAQTIPTTTPRLLATTGPKQAFLVASLFNENGQAALHATNPGDAGTFVIVDASSRLSTEQVVERVRFFPEAPAVEFIGTLYFGPTSSLRNTRDARRERANIIARAPFRFVLNASHVNADGPLPPDAMHVRFSAQTDPSMVGRVFFTMASQPNERIFGMGESFTWMDLKGGILPVLAREQGVGRGLEPLSFALGILGLLGLGGNPAGSASQTTYTAIPHLTTSLMRSIYLENHEVAIMDLSLDDRISLEVNATTLRGGIISAKTPLGLVDAYTAGVSGRMRPLPAWTTQGAIVGMQGGRTAIMEKLARLIAADVPIAAIWLQDWAGRRKTATGSRLYWNWEVDTELYPDWFAWTRALWEEQGIRVLTYANAHLCESSPLFKKAETRRCLVQRDGVPLVQWSSTPDFRFGTVNIFDETCANWYTEVLRENMLGKNASHLAVSGWMADFGEGLPFDVAGPAAHNAFPERWAEVNQRVLEKHGRLAQDEAVFFTRSAGLRTPMLSTLQWMGDQLPTWDSRDGLQSALIGQLAAGLSGLSQTHSDIGGYTMLHAGPVSFTRTLEIFQRWMEHSALADAVFRSHEGLLPDQAVQAWSPCAIAHFARFARLHKALGPMRSAYYAKWPGRPWMQSSWMVFPDEPSVTSLKTQYFVADGDVLVCPVLRPGATTTACYLPGDAKTTYAHIFIPGLVYRGGRTVECLASLGNPCVLARNDRLAQKLQSIVQELPSVGVSNDEYV
ncbi:Alpha-glucosidase [Hondaea fermentalgiana]|uniref:Alpha-glucosidase n=1 Tax=Hondaea fermentalgiana TaxID=2315210 RepID=A0A2R5H164_9STRA|nr:Alpha-glucosidase [Hondaea fermentalgiana]|eukprot:GBG34064.1 Alpha-glucosidase [Hondaea fermentalgiana]